jgi:tetratricopeptide (TPR) repeat protein
MLIFLITSLLYSLLLGSAQVLSRFQNIVDMDRYAAFKGALKIFAEFPIIGSGLGTFGEIFYRYEPASLQGDYYIQTHSDWLQLLAETGGLGFSLVTIAWISFFFKMAQEWRRRRDRLARGLGLGGLAALGAGAFHALAEFPFHIPAISLLYAAIAAITYLTLYSHRRENLEYFTYPISAAPRRRRSWAVALLCLIPLQLVFLIQFSYHWLAEEIAPMEINSTRLPLPRPVENFRKALGFMPENSKYYQGLAEALEKKGDQVSLTEIEPALKSAIFYAPANWGYHLKLGGFCARYYQTAPDRYIPLALKELDAAVKLFPESPRLNLYLASLLAWAEKYYQGQVPLELQGQSGRLFDKAIKLDPTVKNILGSLG